MGKGFEINEAGVREMERKLQHKMNEMNVTIPIEAKMSSTLPLLRQQQNALLQAYYDLGAFDIFSTVLSVEAAERAELDDAAADRALRLCRQDHLLETPTFNPAAHLTPKGRQYVESLEQVLPGAFSTIINNSNGPSNNQIATGDNAVQYQTNITIDTELLDRFFELVDQFDTSVLSEADQADFAEDLTIIESPRTDAAVEASVVRRALRSAQAIAMTATGSASGRLLAEFIADQML